MKKEKILSDIESSISLSDHEAVNILWTALTNAADLIKNASECEDSRQRIALLVTKLSEEQIKTLLKNPVVDSLVFLDPPLETILTDPEGTPDEDSTMRAIGKLRSSREPDPGESLINLARIIEKIHSHMSKSEPMPYDKEILSITFKILYLLCMLTISKLD